MIKHALLSGLCLFAIPSLSLALEAPDFNLEVSIVGDSNLNKAQSKIDISEDRFYELRASAAYFFNLNLKHALIVSGSMSNEEYTEFKGLSKTAAGLNLTWQFITRSGFNAPLYSLSISVEETDFETDIRDGQTLRFGANINKRLTDRITVISGLDFKQHEADSQVFDNRESRFFTNFDYVLNHQSTLYATYSFISGDIVSTATPTLVILNEAEVLEPDNAFGGATANAIAYRLNAKTQVLNFGFNYAINERNSLDFSVMDIQSRANATIEYDRILFRATYLTRF